MRRYIRILAGGVFAGLACAAHSQGVVLPWGVHSDLIAWEEFVRITAPSGNPGIKKVEFETWATDADIYAKSPAQWPAVDAPKVLRASALGRSHARGARPLELAPDSCTQPGGPNDAARGSGWPTGACIGEEVRRNWASFQYIVSNGLDSRSGLAKAFANKLKVDLPADSVEFKGDWAKVSDVATWLKVDPAFVRSHYYTSFTSEKGVRVEVALLSFHISTKQIKDWVWSDFEGSMNLGRCDVIGCRDSIGAVKTSVAPYEKPYQSYGDCVKSDAVLAMMKNSGIDPIWKNYCLKGSQVTFVDAQGSPTRLGNSVIEPLNADVPISKSSCITCHGYASFDKDGKPNPFALSGATANPLGNIDTQAMRGFLPNDFIWGIVVDVKP
jgi:hypothetical protein